MKRTAPVEFKFVAMHKMYSRPERADNCFNNTKPFQNDILTFKRGQQPFGFCCTHVMLTKERVQKLPNIDRTHKRTRDLLTATAL